MIGDAGTACEPSRIGMIDIHKEPALFHVFVIDDFSDRPHRCGRDPRILKEVKDIILGAIHQPLAEIGIRLFPVFVGRPDPVVEDRLLSPFRITHDLKETLPLPVLRRIDTD